MNFGFMPTFEMHFQYCLGSKRSWTQCALKRQIIFMLFSDMPFKHCPHCIGLVTLWTLERSLAIMHFQQMLSHIFLKVELFWAFWTVKCKLALFVSIGNVLTQIIFKFESFGALRTLKRQFVLMFLELMYRKSCGWIVHFWFRRQYDDFECNVKFAGSNT